MEERASKRSIIASIGLAVLTLSVFYTLRNNGPESAVRRFHDAILKNNREEMVQVTDGSFDTAAGRTLINQVGGLLFTGSRYQVVGQSEYPNVPPGKTAVIAEVLYRRPDGMRVPMLFIVAKSKDDPTWKVDVQGTYYLFVRAFGS